LPTTVQEAIDQLAHQLYVIRPVITPVALGAAGNYVILSTAGISNVPTSTITGNIGINPGASTFITGFTLVLDPSGIFSTSSQVTGNVYAADYASPTPIDLNNAIHDMSIAYTDAAGRTPSYTNLYIGDIGGQTLIPGVYNWSTNVTINLDVTLNGGATDIWIFQTSGGINQSTSTNIILTGGAQAKNIFWQSAGSVVIGAAAQFEGVILSNTSITMGTGASINGRLLSQTAISLESNTVAVL